MFFGLIKVLKYAMVSLTIKQTTVFKNFAKGQLDPGLH